MTKILILDELVECLRLLKPTEAEAYNDLIVVIKTRMATRIASHDSFSRKTVTAENYLATTSQDQMLEDLALIDADHATLYQKVIEDLANQIAARLADLLNITASYATFQGVDFAGTCVHFYPKVDGAPCPPPLANFDPGGEWSEEACLDTQEELMERAKANSIDLHAFAQAHAS